MSSYHLSHKEKSQILSMKARQMSARQIASQLNRSHKSVCRFLKLYTKKNHLKERKEVEGNGLQSPNRQENSPVQPE